MKANQFFNRWGYAGCVAFCVALFTFAAADTPTWFEFPVNLYGYGADILEAVSGDAQAGGSSLKQWPMAGVGTYNVRDSAGIREPVFIKASDQVTENFIYGLAWNPAQRRTMISSQAWLTDFPATQNDRSYNLQVSWAVYMTAQAYLICSNNFTYSSPVAGGRGTPPGDEGVQYVEQLFQSTCPDGSAPISAQAHFTHGIRDAVFTGIHLIH